MAASATFSNTAPTVLVFPWYQTPGHLPVADVLQQYFQYGFLKKLTMFSTNLKVQANPLSSVKLQEAVLGKDDALKTQLNQWAQRRLARYALSCALVWDESAEQPQVAQDEGETANEDARLKKDWLFRIRIWDCKGGRWALDSTLPLPTLQLLPYKTELTDFILNHETFNTWMNSAAVMVLLALDSDPSGQCIPRMFYHRLATNWNAYQALVTAETQSVESADRHQAYLKALQLDPTMEQAYVALGRYYKGQQQFPIAVEAYKKAIEVAKTPANIKAGYATEIGLCCTLLGMRDKAIKWWEKALEISPNSLMPHINIGLAYEEDDKLEQAVEAFLKAQVLNGNDFRTYINLARVYSKLNQWDKAVLQYKQQLETNPNDPYIYSDIANCHLQLGNTLEARKALEQTALLDTGGEAGEYAKLVLMGLEVAA